MNRDLAKAEQVRTALSFLAVAVAYAALSYIGLGWAQVRGAGSPIWPAAGVGIAGLMLGGVRLWPAIVVGRLAASVLTGSEQPLWAEIAIAGGNALATVIPALILSRLGKWEESLQSLGGFLRFCLFGVLGQALLAGLIGTAVLVLSSGSEVPSVLKVFSNWSIGAFVGALTVGPLILAWSTKTGRWTARRIAGFAALMAVTTGLAWLIFTSTTNESLRTWHILPLLIVASLTFNVRGTSAALLIMSAIAAWGSSRGLGPFNQMASSGEQQVFIMQQFVGTMALTTLILSVVTVERRKSDILAAEQEYLRRAEQVSRARAEELEAILSAVPATVIIANDPECREMSTNQFGTDMLKQLNWSDSVANLNPKVRMLDRSGKPLLEDERPMRRAAKGEIVSNFQGKLIFTDGSMRDFLGAARPLYDEHGAVRGAVGAFLDMTDRRKAEERITLLALEVDHRAKNIMSVVQAMVRLTTALDIDSFRAAITGRIGTLARTHNLLAANRWEGVSMRALVRDEFAAYGLGSDEGAAKRTLRASGPDLQLPPAAAQSLALVLHELITNAIKYGALSAAGGWVTLDWTIEGEAEAKILLVEWVEEGGPQVSPPEKQGFGTSLIANSIKHQLSGTIDIDWRATGLRVALVVPLGGQRAD
jgi:two-component sensor histidine kinase/integral membrane sensor domain MASE1